MQSYQAIWGEEGKGGGGRERRGGGKSGREWGGGEGMKGEDRKGETVS